MILRVNLYTVAPIFVFSDLSTIPEPISPKIHQSHIDPKGIEMAPNCSKIGLQTVGMPTAGLGTWLSNKEDCERAIDAALEAGVRLIDTATAYSNEANIGNVLKKWFDSGKNIN